jgi:hypothetical protein
MMAKQPFKLPGTVISPPQTFAGEVSAKLEHSSPLFGVVPGSRRVGSRVEIDHDLRLSSIDPFLVGDSKFVFSSRFGVGDWGAETFPENSHQKVVADGAGYPASNARHYVIGRA